VGFVEWNLSVYGPLLVFNYLLFRVAINLASIVFCGEHRSTVFLAEDFLLVVNFVVRRDYRFSTATLVAEGRQSLVSLIVGP
jgi:hypothetical protein